MSKTTSSWKVPLTDITLGSEEIDAVTRVLKSGWLSMGPKTEEFEHHFAEFLGIKHTFAVASGTAALHLACQALGLKEKDEVLCPALTFVASANAILYTGATPIFVDIYGPDNLNLDPEDAVRKVTDRTRAIMVVHYGGYPCDMDALGTLARQYHLKIIEDCAHAPGATYHSRDGAKKVGTMGEVSCFSFFANKNMTTGEGGLVATSDDELAAKIRILRSHGMTSLTWDRHKGHSFSYDVIARGHNYRLDEMRAALGLVQLTRLTEGNNRRRALTQLYQEGLAGQSLLELPFLGAPEGSSYHLFPVLLPPGAERGALMAAMAGDGIQTSVHYPPIPRFSYYRSLWPPHYNHRLPLTDGVADRLVTLPLYPGMTADLVHLVTGSMKKALQG
jgi:dTDP-4-amino-4,6-dideoxygalactose transaminase